MHPPFPFRLRRKGNGPCTVISALRAAAARRLRSETPRCGSAKRKGAWAQNGTVWLICLKRGVPARKCCGKLQSKRWARSSSSQSPYSSLPACAESSLISMLVLSPRKPLRWVFAGSPCFAETCRRAARDALLPCIGLQNRLALLLFPLSLPLPPG